VTVHRYSEDFLRVFSDAETASRVPHAEPPRDSGLRLVFHHWRRHAGALFSPLRFKVLLAVSNLPAQLWSVEVVQAIVGLSCLVFEPAPRSVAVEDLSRFFVVAWAKHLDLISVEVGCIVSEPAEPSVVGQRPLFLRESEVIHSKQDMLQQRAFIQVLEVQDFYIPGVDISEDSSSWSEPNEFPRYDPGRGSGLHRPWSRVFCHVTDDSPSGDAWPSLPFGRCGVSWSLGGPWSRCDQDAHPSLQPLHDKLLTVGHRFPAHGCQTCGRVPLRPQSGGTQWFVKFLRCKLLVLQMAWAQSHRPMRPTTWQAQTWR
jgi:hypothetical protein